MMPLVKGLTANPMSVVLPQAGDEHPLVVLIAVEALRVVCTGSGSHQAESGA